MGCTRLLFQTASVLCIRFPNQSFVLVNGWSDARTWNMLVLVFPRFALKLCLLFQFLKVMLLISLILRLLMRFVFYSIRFYCITQASRTLNDYSLQPFLNTSTLTKYFHVHCIIALLFSSTGLSFLLIANLQAFTISSSSIAPNKPFVTQVSFTIVIQVNSLRLVLAVNQLESCILLAVSQSLLA